MSIKAVIFDFGGVLMRTEEPAGRARWEQRLGLEHGQLSAAVFDADTARQATIGRQPAEAVWENVASRFQLNQVDLAALQADFWAGDRLDEELVRFLGRLRPQYKTAILSNAWSDARENFTDKYGLAAVTDTMIISAEEGVAKPNPEIYLRAVQRLEIVPEEAIFVDDFSENIQAALALGLHAIWFQSTPQVMAAIQACLAGPPCQHTP